jgi:tetratricopeptide (TPR) repeat protein
VASPGSADDTVLGDTSESASADSLADTRAAGSEAADESLEDTRAADPPDAIDPHGATASSGPPARRRALSPRAEAALATGATIGRYVVLEFLGAGAMGAVHAAYDPELDRKVAIKVLLADTGGDVSHRQRLVREAQALARLQHPNVVAVHDVGEHAGRVFVAMEFVRGTTLRGWLSTPRSSAEIVAVFVDAARGLAAAHAHGLVHRDFKPDNVMIDEAGRVRVMDFGLARVSETSIEPEPDTMSATGSRTSMLSVELSVAGSVAGTPAYMSPEQYAGRDVDARSDQFSLCVALFEAFANKRPFAGETLAELAANICAGRTDESAAAAVPAWIRRIVLRGLRPAPDERWPSMDALIGRLARDPRRRARISVAVIASVVAIGGALVWGRAAADRTCDGGSEIVAQAWNESRRGAVEASFRATSLPYVETALEGVLERLDAFGTEYATSHRDACEATEVRREQSAELMDARMRCLAHRFDDFAATIELVEQADAALVERASDLVAALPSLAPCSDPDYVAAKVPPPDDPAVAAEVAEMRAQLSRARARINAGRYAEAESIVADLESRATQIDYAPVRLLTTFMRAELAADVGEHERAAEAYESAFFEARPLGLDELRMDAAIELVLTRGFALAQPDAGKAWARHARSEVETSGSDRSLARLLGYLGSVHRRAGDTDQALELMGESLRIETAVGGDTGLQASQIHNNLCTLHHSRGDHDKAREHCDRALEIRREELGEDHPKVADTLNNLGGIHYARGDTEAALEVFQSVAEITRRSVGEDRPAYARALNNIGAVHQARGDNARAAESYEQAKAIWTAALGPRHPDVALVLNNLGIVAATPEAQLAYYEEALSIREEVSGRDGLDVAETLNNMATTLQKMGRKDEALAHFQRALAILEGKGDARNPRLAMVHHAIGNVLEELGRPDEARAAFERALLLVDVVPPGLAATIRFALASSLPPSERTRARQLATQARASLVERSASAEELAQVDEWLRENPG